MSILKTASEPPGNGITADKRTWQETGEVMKILHTVEFYHPSVGGMQEVVKQLSERLVRLGHNVTVATSQLKEARERRSTE